MRHILAAPFAIVAALTACGSDSPTNDATTIPCFSTCVEAVSRGSVEVCEDDAASAAASAFADCVCHEATPGSLSSICVDECAGACDGVPLTDACKACAVNGRMSCEPYYDACASVP